MTTPASCGKLKPIGPICRMSSITRKAIVSVTGILLLGFVIAHLLGNFQMFLGAEALNHYAEKLRSLGPILWGMRIGLLTVFVLHILTALSLARENRAARPIPYANDKARKATYASRVMVISGMLVLVYVLYHLGHFTFGWVHGEHFHSAPGRTAHDVYGMVISSFQDPLISGIYILSMAVLNFHLRQAIIVFPQSIGLSNEKVLKQFNVWGTFLAYAIFLGYIAIPIAVLAGWVK